MILLKFLSILWLCGALKVTPLALILCLAEIYRIVSQKQIRDPPEGDVIRPTNVESIDVKPTVSADSVRKQCCQ